MIVDLPASAARDLLRWLQARQADGTEAPRAHLALIQAAGEELVPALRRALEDDTFDDVVPTSNRRVAKRSRCTSAGGPGQRVDPRAEIAARVGVSPDQVQVICVRGKAQPPTKEEVAAWLGELAEAHPGHDLAVDVDGRELLLTTPDGARTYRARVVIPRRP